MGSATSVAHPCHVALDGSAMLVTRRVLAQRAARGAARRRGAAHLAVANLTVLQLCSGGLARSTTKHVNGAVALGDRAKVSLRGVEVGDDLANDADRVPAPAKARTRAARVIKGSARDLDQRLPEHRPSSARPSASSNGRSAIKRSRLVPRTWSMPQ